MELDWKEKAKKNLKKAEKALAKAKEVVDDPDALYEAAYKLCESATRAFTDALLNRVTNSELYKDIGDLDLSHGRIEREESEDETGTNE